MKKLQCKINFNVAMNEVVIGHATAEADVIITRISHCEK